ncbi:MAG: tetratricopeptide repeat protein [Treponema sp.]|jgi:tetratricopeptide (TPR) repeat protein|nr:tetratricopeptide repeat protein [Treponema sp.]
MKLDPLLSKAARLARSKNYEGALKILKDEEDRYYGSFKYYYLYGVICLYSGAFVDALNSFRQARNIKMKDPNTMLGLAFLYLKRMNTVQAVDYYLDVQEIDPKNKIATKALSVIRKYSDPEALSEWLTPERIVKLFPPIPFPGISVKTVISSAVILAVLIALFFGISSKIRSMPSPRPSAQFTLSAQERNAPVETGGSYKYILTQKQVTDEYDRAHSLFRAHRDEAAKIHLNRILESNAPKIVINNARQMMLSTDVPGFDSFKQSDNPSYSDVQSEPALYRDVHVIWRGMATNLEVTDEAVCFDFLVGYDTRRTLEGIVPVVFKTPVSVNTERPLEVLGKINLSGANMSVTLEGVAIHQSGRLNSEQ